MTDLDRPVTQRDLAEFATKTDLAEFATKRDLTEFTIATKRDFAEFALATKHDLAELASEIAELREATRRDVDDLHRHFDIVAESFKTEFANLYDWTQATTSGLAGRVGRIESNHGKRLLEVETRVTRLEKRRK